MRDTNILENGQEWPRRYAAAEIREFAKSLGRETIVEIAVEDLQEAVEGYQWARTVDDGLTNKGRRQYLRRIIKSCAERIPVEEIQDLLVELDGPTSQRL